MEYGLFFMIWVGLKSTLAREFMLAPCGGYAFGP